MPFSGTAWIDGDGDGRIYSQFGVTANYPVGRAQGACTIGSACQFNEELHGLAPISYQPGSSSQILSQWSEVRLFFDLTSRAPIADGSATTFTGMFRGTLTVYHCNATFDSECDLQNPGLAAISTVISRYVLSGSSLATVTFFPAAPDQEGVYKVQFTYDGSATPASTTCGLTNLGGGVVTAFVERMRRQLEDDTIVPFVPAIARCSAAGLPRTDVVLEARPADGTPQ